MRTRKTTLSKYLLAVVLALPVAFGADMKPVDGAKLEQMASNAVTASDHATVAKQYRLRAESLEAKAKSHSEEARKLEARPRPAIEYKWPAFSRKPWEKERQLAMQAQRAAEESLRLANLHTQRAVERGFSSE